MQLLRRRRAVRCNILKIRILYKKLTEEEKAVKLENFNAWILTIDERIYDWMHYLPKQQVEKFDYSVKSLDEVEIYLIKNYELNDLQDKTNNQIKFEIDAAASYVLKVFQLNWPKTVFTIELDDERNILFNRPAIRLVPPIGMDFSPFGIIPSTLNLKRVGGFRKIYEALEKRYFTEFGDNN